MLRVDLSVSRKLLEDLSLALPRLRPFVSPVPSSWLLARLMLRDGLRSDAELRGGSLPVRFLGVSMEIPKEFTTGGGRRPPVGAEPPCESGGGGFGVWLLTESKVSVAERSMVWKILTRRCKSTRESIGSWKFSAGSSS